LIKKLRKKFIMIAAVSLFSVLAVVVAAINIINNYQLTQNENELLEVIGGSGGRMPDFSGRDDKAPPGGKESSYTDRKNMMRDHKFINEETSYQTRYFVVFYNTSGDITRIDTSHIAAVNGDQAKELAAEALDSGKENGRLGNYRFAFRYDGDEKMTIFLDCRQNNDTRQRFLLISIAISVASWVIVLVLVILFSGRAIRPVIAAHEKQKRFISDASHEIKTPLAIISANTEVLELTSEPNEWTESTKNQIKRLDGLVKDLMRLSRMDESQLRTEFTRFDLSETVSKTAVEFEAPAMTHGESFSLDIDEGIEITGDKDLIAQSVGIFCDNAVKYCDEGGSITVSLKPCHKGIRLAVTNDCRQPPEGDLSRLFDRFYRADEARARNGSGGYGIGLSIAKAAADAHKARIGCSAENGRITFSITFKDQ